MPERLPWRGAKKRCKAVELAPRNACSRRHLGETCLLDYSWVDPITSVAFSADGSRIATGTTQLVELWDARTGKRIHGLMGHYPTSRVAFSADSTRLASGGQDMRVRLWDARTLQPIGEPLSGHEGIVTSVAFSPDSTRLASVGDSIRLWDARTGAPIGKPLIGARCCI